MAPIIHRMGRGCEDRRARPSHKWDNSQSPKDIPTRTVLPSRAGLLRPWRVEGTAEASVVHDANGFALCYLYSTTSRPAAA